MSGEFKRAFMDDDMLDPCHLKDLCEVITTEKGEYDPNTGEYGEDTEVVHWQGMGSIQPYIRVSSNAIQPPLGGISLAADAFQIFLPWEALDGRKPGYKVRSKGRYFEPSHAPLDPAGQHDYWLLIATEVSRT